MNPWLSQTIVQALGWTLVHFLWQGLVIAALLAAGLRLFRTSPAHYKYLAACAAMALMALAPLVTFRLVLSQPEPLPAITPISAKISPVKTSEIFTLDQPARTANPELPTVVFSEQLKTLLPWLVLGWLAGVCALSGRLFLGWLQVRRLRRNATRPLPSPWPEKLAALAQRLGVNRSIHLLQSALIEVPTVIGWLRPVILLPASCLTGLTPGQLEAIIAHELAHIRRHDYLVNLLQSAIETLLFYHPAVWWVSRRIRDERENCCDDLAVEACGDLVGYARALATLEELRPASAQLMLAAAGAPLLQRIRRLAGQPERSAGRASWPMAGIAVLLVLAILAAGRMEHRAAATPRLANETNIITVAQTSPPPVTVDTNASGELTLHVQATNLVYPGKGRQNILTKLHQIRIDTANYSNLTLPFVLSDLTRTALARDPDGKGINFYFDRQDPAVLINSEAVANDSPASATSTNQLDITQVKVRFALNDIPMDEALDAIVKSADHPIRYDVLDYAVVFSLINSNEPPPLEVRTFHVDTNTFIQGLEHVVGIPFGGNNSSGARGAGSSTGIQFLTENDRTAVIATAVRNYFLSAGINLSTNEGKVVIFNDHKGTLTVRATSEDLDKIEAAVQTLNTSPPETSLKAMSAGTTSSPEATNAPVSPTHNTKPPEVVIKAWFVEMPMKEGETNWSFNAVGTDGSSNAARAATVTGLLTAPQFHATLNALEQRDGTDVLHLPVVTTESGRQAQLRAVEMRQFVTSSGLGFGTNRPVATNVTVAAGILPTAFNPGITTWPMGPTLDVLPTVSADGKSIQLTIIPSITEFIGYDNPSNFVRGDFAPAGGVPSPAVPTSPPVGSPTAPQTSAPVGGVISVLTLPHFRLRQVVANVTALDGQTVVIGGHTTRGSTNTVVDQVPLLGNLPVVGGLFRSESTQKIARKQLLVFVTVTLINPDGTLYHTEEERKALWAGPPPQPGSANQ
jgi:beta-lactamase regulating signal transducer with metallopeptidase domain